jgi:hypothetical protein
MELGKIYQILPQTPLSKEIRIYDSEITSKVIGILKLRTNFILLEYNQLPEVTIDIERDIKTYMINAKVLTSDGISGLITIFPVHYRIQKVF